jgi:hypothetical protein
MATKPRTGAAQYIGVSAEEFLRQIDREVKAGAWDDGTQLKPHVREALGQFSKAARAQRLRPRHYVFVWSRYIFIKIEF